MDNRGQAQVMTFTEGKILLPLVRFALPVLLRRPALSQPMCRQSRRVRRSC